MRRAVGPGGPIRLLIAEAWQADQTWYVNSGECIRTQTAYPRFPGELSRFPACPWSAPRGVAARYPHAFAGRPVWLMVHCADYGHNTVKGRPWQCGIIRRALLSLVRS